jgi:hypothetical protein
MPCRSDGRTSAARNFHTRASRVQTKGMVVQTVDLMHAIFISDARASGPLRLVSGRLDFECDTCLMDERVQTGIHIVRTVASWSSSKLLDVQILILASARIVCNIVYAQVRDRIHRELCCKN